MKINYNIIEIIISVILIIASMLIFYHASSIANAKHYKVVNQNITIDMNQDTLIVNNTQYNDVVEIKIDSDYIYFITDDRFERNMFISLGFGLLIISLFVILYNSCKLIYEVTGIEK